MDPDYRPDPAKRPRHKPSYRPLAKEVPCSSFRKDWCGNMHTDMPGDWPISALCLLNKPSKPPKAPENLRPIALLHPVSKCLATLAAERLRPYVYDLACRFPQFAYVGMRSVEDAIERACAHCAAARTVLAGQKYNLHRRREGHTVGHCKGGLTLSLDLSRAFDCLPREVLHASLRFAQVDAELIDLILHIHRHSKLRIDHKDHRILVELHSGVRQGCSLSPALWSIFICYTLHLLSSRVPLAALTAFSDDILAQWIIDSPQDVLSALKDMAFIIDTLTSLGMSVSDAKTVILDGLRGPQKSRLLKPLLKQHPDRGPCLQLACSRGFLDLPFRHSHTYLGIKLSYGPFERLTLQLRLKQGWSNFSRLFTLLRSNHIKPQQRLQLWQACVFTAIRYGLTSVGLPPDGPDKLRQAVAKQLRLVLKSPSWISHESNADLYHRYQIEALSLTADAPSTEKQIPLAQACDELSEEPPLVVRTLWSELCLLVQAYSPVLQQLHVSANMLALEEKFLQAWAPSTLLRYIKACIAFFTTMQQLYDADFLLWTQVQIIDAVWAMHRSAGGPEFHPSNVIKALRWARKALQLELPDLYGGLISVLLAPQVKPHKESYPAPIRLLSYCELLLLESNGSLQAALQCFSIHAVWGVVHPACNVALLPLDPVESLAQPEPLVDDLAPTSVTDPLSTTANVSDAPVSTSCLTSSESEQAPEPEKAADFGQAEELDFLQGPSGIIHVAIPSSWGIPHRGIFLRPACGTLGIPDSMWNEFQIFKPEEFGALAAQDLQSFIDSLVFPSEISDVLIKARIRLLWKRCSASEVAPGHAPHGLPAAGVFSKTPSVMEPSTWSDAFCKKLSSEAVKAMVSKFSQKYPSEPLGPEVMPSPRLLALVHSQIQDRRWRWVPWKLRLSEEQHDTKSLERSLKAPRLESVLFEEIPSRDLPAQSMGKSQMQELLHLQAVAIAMSDGAHLFTLREMNRTFISKCFESYPKDAGLRPPNRVEAELADQKLWQQIATLFNEEDWSLDQAIREVVVARNEIGVQLMPRAVPLKVQPHNSPEPSAFPPTHDDSFSKVSAMAASPEDLPASVVQAADSLAQADAIASPVSWPEALASLPPRPVDDFPVAQQALQDRDTALWPDLQAGVPTGVDGDISLSRCFLPSPSDFDPASFDVQICSGNWPGANEDPELLDEMVQQEYEAGYLHKCDSLAEAQVAAASLDIAAVQKFLQALTVVASGDTCTKQDLQRLIGLMHWILQIDINSKDDLKLVRCTGKRLWARIADPSTSKRKMPVSLAVPAMDFQYKLAADAFAKGEDIGIGVGFPHMVVFCIDIVGVSLPRGARLARLPTGDLWQKSYVPNTETRGCDTALFVINGARVHDSAAAEGCRSAAEAELALLECWGENPPPTQPMDTDPSAGEKRATSPDQERSKYHRRESKGNGAGKGSGDRPARQMPRPPPRTRRTAAEPNETNTEGMMWMMGRMLLRLEDQMALERFQSGFVMFFRPSSRMSIIPLLAKKSEHWHELKAQKDTELSLALRAFLFRSMFDVIQKRLQETVKNPTQLEAAQQLQVFLPDKAGEPLRIPYLMYNPETRQLEPKTDPAPLTLERVMEILAAILKHSLDSFAILRFHPTQRLSAPIQGPTLPFLLQVGNRSRASFELYDNLILLTNSGLWQLVGGSLRTERMSRNPLAVELQKRLQQKQHER
ncbi:hypothetical protein AK812_SmicGene29782 [Symbiodinium microadriaticum]|uniref:Reverse transcriptase domain-containing protein n=1 Tax=Symbiodinium microadriaticum TaxID=2951 RepID=A0A1Q9D0X8_SYMMI|nr:hypothetical protein AK812_SmicGene29782 [Symbiodinium microadriaticum]